MILSALVAASDNNVIGVKGKIPWFIRGEQARIKEISMGKPLIMGRKTHESVGRVLPGRLNVIISGNPDFRVQGGAVLVSSLNKALDLPEVKKAKEAFIFGGQRVYEEAMPRLERIYLTRVHTRLDGDSFFKFDPGQWKEVSKQEYKKGDTNWFDPLYTNPYDYDFIVLERKH